MYVGTSHILLVDDEKSFRYRASRALQDAESNVTAAQDDRGALVRLDGGAPNDVMVSDIVMPDRVHDFALARMARMRRHEALGKVLRKPLADAELIDEVRRALAA